MDSSPSHEANAELKPENHENEEAVCTTNANDTVSKDVCDAVSKDVCDAEAQSTPVKETEKSGYFRWSYLLVRGTVVALVWAFFAYGFDPLLHRGMVIGSQKAVGAKVEIEHLETEFFPPVLRTNSVQIANRFKPTNNIVEFTSFEGHLDGDALLRRHYVVDRGRIEGLQFDTDRQSNGSLDPKEVPPETEGSESPFKAKVEEFGKKWASDLLKRAKMEADPRQFESVRLAESLKDEWQGDFDDLKERVESIETSADKIKDSIEDKSGGNIERFERYKQAAIDAAKLLKDADTIRQEVQVMPKRAQKDLNDLDAAKDRDIESIKKKIDLLRMDPTKLSEFLIGPELYERMTSTFDWVSWTHERVSDLRNQPKPVRTRGTDVEFPHAKPLPKFLVRLLEVEGQGQISGEPMHFEGTITGISSQPSIHPDPTVVHLDGNGLGTAQVKATIDLRDEIPKNVVAVFYENDKPEPTKLGDDKNLKIMVDAGNLKWRTNVETVDQELNGQIFLIREPVTLTAELDPDTDPRVQSILQQVVGTIKRVEAEVELAGTIKKPTWKLKSNLGPAIADGINGILKKTIQSQQIQLASYVNNQKDTNRQDLIKLFQGEYADVLKKVDLSKTKINNLVPKRITEQPLDAIKKLFRR